MRLRKLKYKDAGGRERETRAWYVRFKDAEGRWQRLPAFADKHDSELFGQRLERLVTLRRLREPLDSELATWTRIDPRLRNRLVKIGLLDEAAASRPLAEHLEDWRRHLEAKGDSRAHVRYSPVQVKRVFDDCAFRVFDDIRAERVQQWLQDLREKQGRSRATANSYIRAIKGFSSWMCETGRGAASPVTYLRTLNAEVNKHHPRRALTETELRDLLWATRRGKPYQGMTGEERWALYLLAVTTGYRAGELRSMTRNDFDFTTVPATVTITAAAAKNRRKQTQALDPRLAPVLQDFMYGKFPMAPVFQIPAKTAAMLREDLEAAGIPYKDESGAVVDFHALRRTFVTLLEHAGAGVKTMQTLARHSTPVLTLNAYTDPASLTAQAATLARLPDLASEEQRLAIAVGGMENFATTLPKPCQKAGFSGTDWDKSEEPESGTASARKPAKTLGKPATVRLSKEIRPGGFEPPAIGLEIRCSPDVTPCETKSYKNSKGKLATLLTKIAEMQAEIKHLKRENENLKIRLKARGENVK